MRAAARLPAVFSIFVLAIWSSFADAQSCQGDQHECSNGLCIPRSQTCDHHNDCGDRDNSDEDDALCSSVHSYRFCGYLDYRGPSCAEYSALQLPDNSSVIDGVAVYMYTAPETLKPTYLSEIHVNWQLLIPGDTRDVTVILNISLPGSSQATRKLFWHDISYFGDDPLLRVPLRVDTAEFILVSAEYTADFKNSSLVSLNRTCETCVHLRYATYRTDCECLGGDGGYAVWRSRILESQYVFGTACGVAEYNEILFSLYEKCLGPPSFNFTSPDVTSFLGDVVTLSCIGTGDVPPLVEWRDNDMKTLESGLNSVDLKVVVDGSPQRFRCVLDGVIFSDDVTVSKWSSECEDIYFNQDLRGYRLAPQCYSAHTSGAQGAILWPRVLFDLNFNLSRTEVVHRLSILFVSDVPLSTITPLLLYNIQMGVPGREFLLYYYNQQFSDGYGTFELLNEWTAWLDLEIVPPVVIEDPSITVLIETQSNIGWSYLRDATAIASLTLTTIACGSGHGCEGFFREWTNLEAVFLQLSCDGGLHQEYMSYRQCQETQGPAPALLSAPSLIEVPRFYSPTPFSVKCAIDNAASYDWYRIGAGGRRDFVTGGYALIFPNFRESRDQGVYVCVGRGKGIHSNVTVEYKTAIIQSGYSTLKVTMTLKNMTFTEDLRDSSSAAFSNLDLMIDSELQSTMDEFRSEYPSASLYQDVERFYPGSVIFDLLVYVRQYDSVNRTSDDELVSSLQFLLLRHSFGNSSSGLEFDPGNVTVVTLTSCPQEVVEVAGRNLTFRATKIGNKRDLLEECISNTNQGGLARVSRMCAGDFVGGAYWQEPVLGDCSSDVNGQLNILNQVTVTADNVDEVAQSLAALTGGSSFINGAAVSLVADILDNIVNVRDPSPEVTANVVKVVDNLLQVNDDIFDETPNANSSSRIVQALESQISYVLEDGGNFTGVTRSLAVEALNIPAGSLSNGLGFAATEGKTANDPLTGDRVDVYYSDSVIPQDEVEASIQLPEEILQKLPTGVNPVPISFILYQSSKLFRSQRLRDAEAAGVPRSVGGSVISATVNGFRIINLPVDAPVATTFLQNKENQEYVPGVRSMECVFWDFSLRSGIGDWSGEGCRKAAQDGQRTTCHCDHTTSFAVLVDLYGLKESSLVLDIISKIGCGISIGALAITIIVYLAMKSLRGKTPGRILICFSASLLSLYVVFLVGVEQTSSRVGCIVVAVLMHYFTLTSVAWMGVEATNLYLKLVKVFDAHVEHFMVKASVAAWGLPMVVVGVILGVDYTVYENKTSCFLKASPAFYYGQLLMIGLVFFYNAIIFVLVLRKLTCKASKIQSSSNRSGRGKVARRLQNIVAISVLLGLTWAFGLLAVIEAASFTFQILFSVFNSLQGLFIFLLFVLRQEKIQERLRGLCRKNVLTLHDTLSTNPSSKSPPGKDESSEKRETGQGGQDGSGLAMDQLDQSAKVE